jgi:hypothetical protein
MARELAIDHRLAIGSGATPTPCEGVKGRGADAGLDGKDATATHALRISGLAASARTGGAKALPAAPKS